MNEFVTIKIPKSLYERIQDLKKRYSIQEDWQLILEAINLYEVFKSSKKPKKEILKELPRLDKASWYVYKFAKSVSLFLEDPNNENFAYLNKRINELIERIFGRGSEISLTYLKELEELITEYKKVKSTRLKIEINELAKLIISEIIVKMLFEEEKERR